MHGLDRELRDAFRSLISRPAFLATAVLTLAVGIGANATVFAFVDALFLRPLPFGDRSERIVTLHSTHPTLAPNLSRGTMTYADVRGLSSMTRAFDRVAGYIGRNGVVIGRGDFVERVRGGLVTPGLFEVLGTRPFLGRTFVEEDAADPGFEQAVMISHGLWRRLFDASPDAVGQPFQMNGRSLTLIGVMPPGFRFPERDDLWLPYRPADGQQQLRNRNLLGIAALSEGTSIDQAERELGRISVNLGTDIPDMYRNWTMRVTPFRASFVGREATLLMATLLGAVLFVLAIGCANLANLLLVRGMSRQREMAIRVAMGAGRLRLAWQVLLECLIVSVAGASIGVVGATWAIDIIVAAFPEDLPHWAQVGIDWRVVAFVSGVSILATVMFGLYPAFRSSRANVIDDLKESGPNASSSQKQNRLNTGLVAAQIAMCLALLVGANMTIRSFMQLMNADSGFDDSELLSFRVPMSGDQYDPLEAKVQFVRALEEELRTTVGVTEVGATTAIPIDDGGSPQRVTILGRTVSPNEEIGVSAVFVTPGFFAALGLQPVAGRLFSEAENGNPDADVVIVSRSFAREFLSDGAAIGKRLALQTARGPQPLQIVGVIPDIQFEEFGEETQQSRRNIYYPYGRGGSRALGFMVRTEGNPATLLNSMRAALRRIDPNLPVFELRTMSEVRRYTTFEQRLIGQMMGVFGGIALFLACLGLYGLLTYSVSQRTAEIGIRVALGATSRDVVSMVLYQGAQTAFIGITIGMLISLAVARFISGVLFRVSHTDPVIFATTGLLLTAVVLLTVCLPARRASKIDPSTALRRG